MKLNNVEVVVLLIVLTFRLPSIPNLSLWPNVFVPSVHKSFHQKAFGLSRWVAAWVFLEHLNKLPNKLPVGVFRFNEALSPPGGYWSN